ncbi:flavodoxin [Georgenia sp. 311]|uniref:Flavodoxin n=1 Tax=Georgenia wutianyii TaxID=2585135 RepID=A0ABX5VMB5_9MICO|nr:MULTISPECIES: flavodoxin domain-containing protein [Georgenia]QDB78921.1 flavodoxin [Georgenia wutianyii]TNC17098.1 flavodoxin [Georgenia sp. 311]
MDAAVVYESSWGNTRAVAQAVAQGLRERLDVEVLEVGTAPPPHELTVDVLVVGGPTHAFGMSRPATREDAEHRGGQHVGTGIREWLASSEPLDLRGAAFDTHLRHPDLPGHASRKAAKALHRLGADLLTQPESFWVEGTEGPLLPGELDRARAWGTELAALASSPDDPTKEEP